MYVVGTSTYALAKHAKLLFEEVVTDWALWSVDTFPSIHHNMLRNWPNTGAVKACRDWVVDIGYVYFISLPPLALPNMQDI